MQNIQTLHNRDTGICQRGKLAGKGCKVFTAHSTDGYRLQASALFLWPSSWASTCPASSSTPRSRLFLRDLLDPGWEQTVLTNLRNRLIRIVGNDLFLNRLTVAVHGFIFELGHLRQTSTSACFQGHNNWTPGFQDNILAKKERNFTTSYTHYHKCNSKCQAKKRRLWYPFSVPMFPPQSGASKLATCFYIYAPWRTGSFTAWQ
jgi:hypothetical protein